MWSDHAVFTCVNWCIDHCQSKFDWLAIKLLIIAVFFQNENILDIAHNDQKGFWRATKIIPRHLAPLFFQPPVKSAIALVLRVWWNSTSNFAVRARKTKRRTLRFHDRCWAKLYFEVSLPLKNANSNPLKRKREGRSQTRVQKWELFFAKTRSSCLLISGRLGLQPGLLDTKGEVAGKLLKATSMKTWLYRCFTQLRPKTSHAQRKFFGVEANISKEWSKLVYVK